MAAGITWSPVQARVLAHKGHTLVIGGPGSGKTALLLARARQLAGAGQPTALTTFAFRSNEYLKSLTPPDVWSKLTTGTVTDLAAAQLKAAGQSFTFATNNQVREVLRGVVAAQAFAGSLRDAEQIVRSAKSRAKKLAENDRYYPLVQAYRTRMEELGLVDRHDLIRMHVRGIKDGSVPALPVKYMLLDNLQDATELQLIWLQAHAAGGVKLVLTGDDDITAFGPDGAQGAAALETAGGWDDMETFTLEETFRLPQTLAPAVGKLARQLRHRVGKGLEGGTAVPGTLRAEIFPHAPAEHVFLAETAIDFAQKGQSVGVVTRTDFEAALLTHALRKHGQRVGLNPASFARLIWEEPTPQLVLALLYLMLGQATNGHLRLVLYGFGVSADAVEGAFADGLNAEGWLAQGCPLPSLNNASPTTLAAAQGLRRSFKAAWQVLQSKSLNPREVFKAMVGDLLPHLPASEQPAALLATDMLLTLSGKLTEVLPRVRTETLPDMASPVTVAPVRELRNRAFDVVMIAYADAEHWPSRPSALLGPDPEHERRLFYLAATRTSGSLILTRHTPNPTPFLAELQQSLKQQARKA